jgi:hypothetical protein
MDSVRKYARTGLMFNLTWKNHQSKMHLQSMLLSQVDGISSNEDAQKFHSTKETLSIYWRKKKKEKYIHKVSHAVPGPVIVVPIAVPEQGICSKINTLVVIKRNLPIWNKLMVPTQLHSNKIREFLPLDQTKSANALLIPQRC